MTLTSCWTLVEVVPDGPAVVWGLYTDHALARAWLEYVQETMLTRAFTLWALPLNATPDMDYVTDHTPPLDHERLRQMMEDRDA